MIAAGVWFYSVKTNRYLYLLRSGSYEHTWGLPGGKVKSAEPLLKAIERECIEEIGMWPEVIKLVPIEKFTSNDYKFEYHTFFALVDHEFVPTLNNEHYGYAWIDSGIFPKPLHPGLWSTVNFDSVQTKVDVVRQQHQTSQ